jgi:hypothetical protein
MPGATKINTRESPLAHTRGARLQHQTRLTRLPCALSQVAGPPRGPPLKQNSARLALTRRAGSKPIPLRRPAPTLLRCPARIALLTQEPAAPLPSPPKKGQRSRCPIAAAPRRSLQETDGNRSNRKTNNGTSTLAAPLPRASRHETVNKQTKKEERTRRPAPTMPLGCLAPLTPRDGRTPIEKKRAKDQRLRCPVASRRSPPRDERTIKQKKDGLEDPRPRGRARCSSASSARCSSAGTNPGAPPVAPTGTSPVCGGRPVPRNEGPEGGGRVKLDTAPAPGLIWRLS